MADDGTTQTPTSLDGTVAALGGDKAAMAGLAELAIEAMHQPNPMMRLVARSEAEDGAMVTEEEQATLVKPEPSVRQIMTQSPSDATGPDDGPELTPQPPSDAPPSHTLTAALSRLETIAKGAQPAIVDLECLVSDMAGVAEIGTVNVEDFFGASVEQAHQAADAFEALFGRVAALVKQAREAHG